MILNRVGQTRICAAMDDDRVTHLDMWGPGKQPDEGGTLLWKAP